jgi:hypothetical protein
MVCVLLIMRKEDGTRKKEEEEQKKKTRIELNAIRMNLQYITKKRRKLMIDHIYACSLFIKYIEEEEKTTTY